MRKMFAKDKESVFWKLILSSFIPGGCSALLLSVIFLPLLLGAAKENDSAYEKNILYSTNAFFEALDSNATDVVNQIEKSEWIHDVYIDHIINENPLTYDIKKSILLDLALSITRFETISYVSLRYYDKPDVLFTNKGIIDNAEYYQEHFPDSMHYFFFPSETGSDFISTNFRGEEYLIYSVPVTDIEGGRKKGEINIVFNNKQIDKKLRVIADGQLSGVGILKESGDIAWEYPLSREKKTTLLWGGSRPMIQIEIPKALHGRTGRRIMVYVIVTIFIDLIFCSLLACVFSKKIYSPVEKIVETFGMGVSRKKNEFESLSYMLGQIVTEKKEADLYLERLRPLARQKVIGNLLDKPGFLNHAYAEEQLKYCKIEFTYSLIDVVSVQIPFSKQSAKEIKNLQQAAELAIQTIVEQLCLEIELFAYLYQENINRYKIIVNYNSGDVLQTFLRALEEKGNQYLCEEKISDHVYIGIGNRVKNCNEIFQASEQADMVVDYCMINCKAGIFFYPDIQLKINNHYSYPLSDEILLTRAITEGNAVLAKSVLEKILGDSSRHPIQSIKGLQLLYSNLLFTVMRSAQNIGIAVEPNETYGKDESSPFTFSYIEQSIGAKIDEICVQVEKICRDAALSEEDAIMDYIDTNIFNASLSLNEIADRYHKSSAYISVLFKNKKGINYTDYVNKARIDKAVELLSNMDADMDSVYHAVGYISLSTFRRNFIKYTKQNPSQFLSSVSEKKGAGN